ncbi:MAG: outer membrane protein transport protein [Acidobacteriota bacterium]
MSTETPFRATCCLIALMLWIAPDAASASGFAVETQDAHAAALGGAFTGLVGPASVFYNPGAAAFLDELAYGAGSDGMLPDISFEAEADDLGVRTVYDRNDTVQLLPHAFTVTPLRKRANLGVAITQPYALDVTWDQPDSFPARSLVTTGLLRAVDVTATLSLKLSDSFGLGFGAVYRSTNLEIDRRIQTTVSDELTDYGSLATTSGEEPGFGWTLGLYHEPSKTFAWGLTYRSAISIDVGLTSTATQISTGDTVLDAALELANPFDQALGASTPVDYPASASLGVRLGSPELAMIVADVRWTEWSRFSGLAIDVPDFPDYDITYSPAYVDAFGASLGVQYTLPGGTMLRAGIGYDESAQSDDTVDPLFYDGDRLSIGAGVGRDWLEVALRWDSWESRAGSFEIPDDDDLSGTFDGQSVSLIVTIKQLPDLTKLEAKLPEAPAFSLQ